MRKNFKTMKTSRKGRLSLIQPSMIALLLLPVSSCDLVSSREGGKGSLSWRFSPSSAVFSTRSSDAVVDTNNFILDIRSVSGEEIYSGPYHSSPETIDVAPGEYVVNARSMDFSAPQFAMPQYGDEQAVIVEAGKKTRCTLVCGLANCGIRRKIGSSFRDTYPDGRIYVESADGSLEYSENEKRIAYFRPGTVSVTLKNSGAERKLYSRDLAKKEVLTLGVSAPPPGEGGQESGMEFEIAVDTTMTWIYDSAGTDGPGGGNSASDNAYNVGQALGHIGESGVWVYGYIVGGDLTRAAEGVSFKGPFSSRTNIVIASRSVVSSKSSCLSVQLSKESVRGAINLADHPGMLGRMVWLKGDIVEAYYGIPGLKNVTEYALE